MDFVDRERELKLLDDLYQRKGAQFLVLYGRRRIGKTRLITTWLGRLEKQQRSVGRPTKHLYWMAAQTSATNQLRSFSQAVLQFLNPGARIDPTFSYATWEAAFSEVCKAASGGRLVLVLDEFTYVIQADTQVPSLLQRAWDHELRDQSEVFLILTGSLAGMIQRHVLDYQAPLYGRATARIRLQPLSFGAMADLFPRYRVDQRLAVYAITGGVPAYVELVNGQLTITQNLKQRLVTPANVMLGDAAFLLHEQLDEPRNYMAIIETIAAGSHALSEIALQAGIERGNIIKYLGVLQELGYVERRVSAIVRRPERSRKGRYVLVDPYLHFYFRFLAPHLSFIERGMTEPTINLLRDHLTDFIGTHTFEELCREWVAVQADSGALPFLPERIGSIWSREVQVDVAAVNWRSKDILLGECKWGASNVGQEVLRALVDKTAGAVPGEDWQVHYALFARRGFTPAAMARARRLKAHLVTLDQIEADLREWMKKGA
ncbi:MAG TPA: ATP-binding protein [Anaerolineales bacterium]|nr:ATP-binding protein [Anaerolineales bacterium]